MVFDDEEIPPRSCRSKNFIPKTMFVAAAARPSKGRWNGKIGLWPFTEQYEAKKKSRYIDKGKLCTRNIETVNRDVSRSYLIRYVISAIKTSWPRGWDRRRSILIQQDNAKPHVPVNDPGVVGAGTADGWNIRMIFQPVNSPDLNCLDLGLFASLQSLQYDELCNNIDELIQAEELAYATMHTAISSRTMLALKFPSS
ncbi:hypothetical protein JG688_00014964 [Phytophthora aleatoria]|uniref:Uncharacterized protein n=1 Tax=Phytophthora aleatoria TaxID=2496075 RepID=A0A8J5IIZ4_9STRA|nr:hypothetical protein JG688_00014964 [Phytophthora aleatoria]